MGLGLSGFRLSRLQGFRLRGCRNFAVWAFVRASDIHLRFSGLAVGRQDGLKFRLAGVLVVLRVSVVESFVRGWVV